MQYLRNITLFCAILLFNIQNLHAQVDEIRNSQLKGIANSYDEIILNEKNFTLQNIEKIQNVIETLDYPSEFNFKQLLLSTYNDRNEEEYNVEDKLHRLISIIPQYMYMQLSVNLPLENGNTKT